MKAIYYLVTFLAAVVVLGLAGLLGYKHYQAGDFNSFLPPACCSKACPAPAAKKRHCQCGCTDGGTCTCKDCDHPKLSK